MLKQVIKIFLITEKTNAFQRMAKYILKVNIIFKRAYQSLKIGESQAVGVVESLQIKYIII